MKATSVARRRMRERLHAATIRHELLDLPWQPAYPAVPLGSLEPKPYYPLTFHITHQTEG